MVPGVADGYWRRQEETEQTFAGRLADGGRARLSLRTGDLGFLRHGELFITGRLKDLIIIRGDNHYPQDIEWTVEQSHQAFRPGCGAAFSVDDRRHGAVVVVVYELEREYLRTVEPEELCARAGPSPKSTICICTRWCCSRPETVPRTTSGKIQRRQCRADFLHGELPWSGICRRRRRRRRLPSRCPRRRPRGPRSDLPTRAARRRQRSDRLAARVRRRSG